MIRKVAREIVDSMSRGYSFEESDEQEEEGEEGQIVQVLNLDNGSDEEWSNDF